MTLKDKARAALSAARDGLRAAVRQAPEFYSDAVGFAGMALLGRGIWLRFGEPWALMVVGGLLLALSVVAALRGGR